MDGFEIILGTARSSRSSTASDNGRASVGDEPRPFDRRVLDEALDDARAMTPTRGLRLVAQPSTSAGPAIHAPRTMVTPIGAVVHPGVANTRAAGRSVRAALDVFVGGVNVTARADADQAPCILRDLALAMVDLACGTRRRAVVRFYETPWELGLRRIEAAAGDPAWVPMLSINVAKIGAVCEIAVYDRRARLELAMRGTIEAIDTLVAPHLAAERADAARALGPDSVPPLLHAELVAARDALARALTSIETQRAKHASGTARCADDAAQDVMAVVDIDASAPVSFGVELPLAVESTRNPSDGSGDAPPIESSDLHALLGRGRARMGLAGRTRELGEVHTFLFAERLLLVCKPLLEAWQRGRVWHRSVDLAGPIAHIRVSAEGRVTIDVTSDREGGEPAQGASRAGAGSTPSLDAPDLVDAIVTLGRSLARAIVRRDRSQAHNLRLLSLRREAREIGERLREVARPVGPFGESDLVSDRPDPYRRYLQTTAVRTLASANDAHGCAPAPSLSTPRIDSSAPASSPSSARPSSSAAVRKLKFTPRWTAQVPGIDLRATFLCGDRLVLSGATETACVARDDGETLWKATTVRATSLPTAGGLARLRGDGRLELRDFGDGGVLWSQACAPRSKGTPAACTVSAPGLPRLLVASDGDRHLVAFDLASGAPRWRLPLGKPGPIRMRRAGRLLVIGSDEPCLTAVDVVDGRVVWRVRDRLKFSAPPTIEREDLVAVAGEPGGSARLHVIDAPSGARRYERPLFFSVATDLAPMLFAQTIVVVARDRRGVGLAAFDRPTGVEQWSVAAGAWPTGTSVMAIDALLVLNLPTGEVLALDAASGATVWRHIFEAPLQGDAPRRLEPVLRSGALFVPQEKVRVLRPSDGALIGVVAPCELVPDLLRVDERCDVYVAEESGHVAAFAASSKLGVVDGGKPRLSLVKSP